MQTSLAVQRCMSAADLSFVCKYGYQCSVMPDVHAWEAELCHNLCHNIVLFVSYLPLRTSSAAVPPQKKKRESQRYSALIMGASQGGSLEV